MNNNITNFIITNMKSSKIAVLLAALILFLIIPTLVQAAAPAEQWNKTFGGTLDDRANSVQNTSDGGCIIAGTTSSYGAGGSDAWLIKVDSSGNQTWNKTFGGTLDDGVNSVDQTSDGGYIIAGATASYGAGGTDLYGNAYSDVYLIKTDSSGNQQWNKTFGGLNYDHAFSVQQTSDGGYIIVGDTNSSYPDSSYSPGWLIKVDSDGNQQWNTTFGKTDDGFDHHASSVDQTSDGGYIIAGCVERPTSVLDFWLSKVDSDGNQIWSTGFGGWAGDYDHANSVQQTSDGGYILAGEAEGFSSDPNAAWLVKTDINGNMTWDKRFGGGYETDVSGSANSVQQTSDEGYIIAVTISPSDGAPNTDVWLIKVDSNGNHQWTKKFGGTEGESASSVQQTSDGGYIIAGHTFSYGAGSADAWLIKVAPDISTISSMAPTHDNRLRQSSPNTVFSSTNYLDIGRLGTTSYRDVIWFDLSGYDPTDTISKATLSLYWYYPPGATSTSDTIVEIYRPVEWSPQYVTWNSRMSGTPWATAGGNWVDKNGVAQGTTPYASVTFPAGTVQEHKYYEFDVTQLVQEYVTGTNNTGFFLKAKTEGDNYIAFYSSEWPNADQRPKLTITSVPVDNPPVAEAGSGQVTTIGSVVTFNGSASTDDQGINTYSWDFDVGDGISTDATGITAATSYAAAGYYTVTLTITDTGGQSSSDTLHVVVSRPTTTATYTPDYDNRLRQSSPNTVLSTSNYIDIGRLGTTSYRDVMWFDLSGYNSTDRISKATLSLYWYYPPGATRTSDTVVEVYSPLEWSPQYVTWNSRMSGIHMLWYTPGGSWYDKNGVEQGTTPYASVTFPAGTVPDNKYYEFDVTELVNKYVNGWGPIKNTGFFLKAKTEGNNYIAFYSSEWQNADQRPKLTVTSVPADNLPVAEAGPDQVTTIGSVVTFNGGASTDDKGIVSYSWDFDDADGITTDGIGKIVNTTYTAAGTYTVTLTVTDTVGQTNSDKLRVQVVVSRPENTATYTPDYDNRLRQSSPNTVLSSSNYLDIGKLGTTSYRDVMWFDLSGYNSTDTIFKATLSLYWYYPPSTTRTSDTVVEIYRPVNWDPQYVTWNSRMSGTPWATAGGNWFDKNGVAQGSTPYASVTFPAGTVPDNKYYEFDVTQLVKEYVTGTNNTGFLLKAQTESNNYIAFYSSEWPNVDQRPKLTITSVPSDNPPVAEAGPDQVTTIGSVVTFNGSTSTDDKGIVSYSWDFDDGPQSEATTPIVTHTYATPGTYNVTLTVTDTVGQTNSDHLRVRVVVSSPPTTITYTPKYDNRLRQSTPNTVLSSSHNLDIGRLGTTSYRDVMWFDLSGYNSTDTISNATLSLYVSRGLLPTFDMVAEIYRPVEWSPQYVTWNSRMSGMLWDSAGGNWFDKNGVAQGTTPYASVTFPAGTVLDNKYYEFDVTQLVQEYVNGTDNTGFFLRAKTESNNYIAFYSSEWLNADQRPKLTVKRA